MVYSKTCYTIIFLKKAAMILLTLRHGAARMGFPNIADLPDFALL